MGKRAQSTFSSLGLVLYCRALSQLDSAEIDQLRQSIKLLALKTWSCSLYYFQIIRLSCPKGSMSFELKEKGNRLFKESDYNGAEDYFSQACVSL